MSIKSGPVPTMIAVFCSEYQDMEDPDGAAELCSEWLREMSKEDILTRAKNPQTLFFQKAQQVQGAPALLLELDHDEASCQIGHRYCFYSIVVLSSDETLDDQSQVTSYSLGVERVQQNYQLITANKPEFGSVGKNEYRYFKFNQPSIQSGQLEKLSFQLTSLHGDADLFVSKTNPFPQDNGDNEESSKKSRSVVDRIDFTSPSNLSGEYFVGI